MAVIPVLKDKAAVSILKTLEVAKVKPYALKERMKTEQRIRKMLATKE